MWNIRPRLQGCNSIEVSPNHTHKLLWTNSICGSLAVDLNSAALDISAEDFFSDVWRRPLRSHRNVVLCEKRTLRLFVVCCSPKIWVVIHSNSTLKRKKTPLPLPQWPTTQREKDKETVRGGGRQWQRKIRRDTEKVSALSLPLCRVSKTS